MSLNHRNQAPLFTELRLLQTTSVVLFHFAKTNYAVSLQNNFLSSTTPFLSGLAKKLVHMFGDSKE